MSWSPKINGLGKTAAIALFFPAIFEEFLFRAPILAFKTKKNQMIISIVLLVLFVISHPLNGHYFLIQAKEVFSDWRFLTLATALGLVCSYTTIVSKTLLPAIFIHWIFVLAWKGLFNAPRFLG